MNFIINKHFKKGSEEYRKASLLVWGATALFFISVLFIFINSESPVYGKMAFVPPAIVCVCVVLFLYFSGKLLWTINVTCFGILAALLQPLLVSGGINSTIFMWVIITPLGAITIGNLRIGLFWSVVTIFYQIMIYFIDPPHPFGIVLSSSEKFSLLLDHLCFLTLIFVFLMIYELIKIEQKNIIQKQLEKLIEQQTHNLEMIEQLQYIEKALNLSNKEIKSYTFAAAHDLKELLRMIGIHIQVVQKQMRNQTDSTTLNHMSFVNIGVKRMEELLRNLIIHGEIGDATTAKTRIDLTDTCHYAIEKAMIKTPDIPIKIEIAQLPVIFYHEMEIIQLFQNIIDNALKFRKKDVPPELYITYSEDPDEYLFKVMDNGIGIEKEYQNKVFELFARLHNRHDYEGTGMGLAICKKIVSHLGGRIWLNSIEGEGTTVYFSMAKSRLLPTEE